MELTKNQNAVLKVVESSGKAVTAYDILDLVRSEGIRAPVQVYRALDKLMELGHVHRIESLNAFVACNHDHTEDKGTGSAAFAICDDCGDVTEIPISDSSKALKTLSPENGFVLDRAVVELRGQCAPCSTKRS